MTIKFSKTEEFKNAKTALTDAMSANDEIENGRGS